MERVLAFDVNETLLDLKALDPHFERIFGDKAVRVAWFGQFIQSALVATVTDAYTPFGQIGMAALEMTAARRGISLDPADKQMIGQTLSSLPPHPEVRAHLQRLHDAGFRIAALTNSTVAVAEAQLTHAGLRDLFELVLSGDEVQRLKPAPEPYHMTAQRMGVAVQQVRLVAAHAWDIAGALRAGCVAAFIARPGAVLDPLAPRPDIVGNDLEAVTDQILAIDGAATPR
ncbi:MAG: haloacid dehalogenase type II [Chloroflexota bacterium]|nr:haloacid dehalogenase type II [Chloroflexota bacterium]